MAHRDEAPYKPQNRQEVRELVQQLEAHTKKGRKSNFSVRKNTFNLPSNRTVDSWRMQDWDYKKPDLPTYARGLFTYTTLDGNPEIAVRGYDKFFNHGEVSTTRWENVQRSTRGPYELSVKENGCIIFIAGLDDDTLLVCSKHSTGPRDNPDLSHAINGERWIDKQLSALGKTRADLARKLRAMNATAVAELCDDSFEEHVLAYKPEDAGLYLHGINLNLPEFATYPGPFVDKFADEWGFKKVMYVMENDIKKVKAFLDEVSETGNYAGRDTEGFVIRCQAQDFRDGPYHDWFFKYKFEEPYLMYRQWRECTKAIISGKSPRVRKHKKITEEYLLFARRCLQKDPQLGKEYHHNHGIIKMRDDFLKERGLKGSDIIRQEREGGEVENSQTTRNIVLVPVATIGCGKTTVAVALTKLFGWGHVQNDNIIGRRNRPQMFAQAVYSALGTSLVVIADRNNHQKRERKQLIADVLNIVPEVKFVALQYVHDRGNYDNIRKATRERVLSRGDNHQTIQAGSKSQEEIIGIMEGFLSRFEPVDDSGSPDDMFETIIDIDATASSRDNLETVITRLHSEYPKLFKEMPSADDLDNAIEAALNDYKPDLKHDLGRSSNSRSNGGSLALRQVQNASAKAGKDPKVEYFGVQLPASDVGRILATVFRDQDAETSRFYNQLDKSRRIQPEFHVTLIHRASIPEHQGVWERLSQLHGEAVKQAGPGAMWQKPGAKMGDCKVQLERLVWDGRVMCFVVRLLNGQQSGAENGQAPVFETVNPIAHVTVGTANETIKPKESNDLLQKWLQVGSSEETGIKEVTVKGHVVLDGVVRGIMRK
ncbi:tRNA ligase [Patellaria atrata CBS 101060]|uniref:tRNA ligase n=1 Tax=Patellaria atrata CBS 101060 TaxID=1346257 RepID=A0A9P4SIA0_9PEZI|nr:tRNA ligase [Patellaria atrata CBS 101060]